MLAVFAVGVNFVETAVGTDLNVNHLAEGGAETSAHQREAPTWFKSFIGDVLISSEWAGFVFQSFFLFLVLFLSIYFCRVMEMLAVVAREGWATIV